MITKEEIQKLADLARISLTEDEKESLRKDIEGILEYVGQIKEASSATCESWEPAVQNVLREDTQTVKSGEYTEALINVTPKREKGYVKVKKIL